MATAIDEAEKLEFEALRLCVKAGNTRKAELWREALRLYQDALKLNPDSVNAWIGCYTCYRELGDNEKAQECLKKAEALQKKLQGK